MVLFRYGNTGVVECIRKAVSCLNVIPVFPVKNVNNFSSGRLLVYKHYIIKTIMSIIINIYIYLFFLIMFIVNNIVVQKQYLVIAY